MGRASPHKVNTYMPNLGILLTSYSFTFTWVGCGKKLLLSNNLYGTNLTVGR